MEITGKITELFPLQTGEGKNGTWRKQNILIETEGQYPKKVCLTIWGDKVNEGILVVENKVKCSIDLESREYNGKWYTDAKAYKVEGDVIGMPKQSLTQELGETKAGIVDDLPF